MSVFVLPDLGEGLQEAEIVRWHVSVGDSVVTDQPLVTVETDKAMVEIPSPRSGRVARLAADPGSIVRVGEPLAEFDDGESVDAGTVVGEIARQAGAVVTPGERETLTATRHSGRAAVKAVPGVRTLARRLSVDLGEIEGTGPKGTITRSDVEQAAGGEPEGADGFVPLRGSRRAMAARMAAAHAEVVSATVCDDADIDRWPTSVDAMARMVRAVAAGIAAQPGLNAWYDSSRGARKVHDHLDLGIAVDTDDGLFVPVIRNAASLNARELRAAIDRLRSTVAERSISHGELQGQTITMSNFGMIGGRYASLVVVPPQVAIVGVGGIGERVVACDGRAVVHRTLPLSLSFDHRAVTGGEAARFLAAVIEDLELPGG